MKPQIRADGISNYSIEFNGHAHSNERTMLLLLYANNFVGSSTDSPEHLTNFNFDLPLEVQHSVQCSKFKYVHANS